MPTKSTGCYTCRKRKIRCDETRPGCNRCKTHNVPCPGYRLPAKGQLLFQNETSTVVVNAHKSYQTKAPTVYTTVFPISPATTTTKSPNSTALSRSPSTELIWPSTTTSSKDEPEWPLDFSQNGALYPTPTFLPSSAMEKTLIYSTFLDTYLPKLRGPVSSDSHFSFLNHLITTPNLPSSLTAALDAISLVQVGSQFRDPYLLKEAVRAYSRALSGLVKTMASQGAAGFVSDDYALATVTLLAQCEFFDEIAQTGNGWTHHIQGQQTLLAARGPSNLNSRLSLLIYSNMRHGALSHALIKREACYMGSPEWRSVAWRAPHVDSATILFDAALQIPEILERVDNLDAESTDYLDDIDAILEDARRLRTEMKSWYDSYSIRSKFRDTNEDSLFWLTKISNFPTYTSLCSDRTLDEGYMFPTFLVGYLLSVYWNSIHFLQTDVQKLHSLRFAAAEDTTVKAEDMVTEEELMGYVMNLCRCFPFFCEPVSSSTGKIALFLPLRTVSTYFLEMGNWPMLMWIVKVRDSIFTSGLGPPRVSPKYMIGPG